MHFAQDIRYAFRIARKSPAFSAMAILTIALGIGATTLMFSVVRQVLLAPLPYPNSDRLVTVMWRYQPGESGQELNGPMAEFLSQQTPVFQDTGVMFYSPGCNIAGNGRDPEYVPSSSVSPGFLHTLGIDPSLGRNFIGSDATNGSAAIISNRLWRDRFGSDPAVIGKPLQCNGAVYTIVGVLPATFHFYYKSDVWFTEPITRYLSDIGSNYFMIGRLRPELTLAQAQQRIEHLSASFTATHPESLWSRKPGQTAVLQSFAGFLHEDSRGSLLLLFGAVVLVLLIAVANVAGLLVARAVGRGREVAVRSAVGASRGRLFTQLITESVVLSLLGGAAGIALMLWGMDLIHSTIASRFPEIAALRVDTSVLLFALAAAIVTGALAGLLPAWHVARGDTFSWMKHGTASRGQRRSRKVLIAAEVALALVLLSGSTLLLRSFARTRAVNPGFDMNDLYSAELSLGEQKYQSTQPVARFVHDATANLNRIPGVHAAAEAAVPIRRGLNLGFKGGRCDTGGIQFRAVTPDFFATMRIPVLQGRTFTEGEAAPLAIVNEKLAKACWPDGDAVGSSMSAQSIRQGGPPPRQVIGVVGSTREYGLARTETSVVYVPVWQVPDKTMKYNNGIFDWSIVVRASGTADVASLIRNAVREADPEQAIIGIDAVSNLAGRGLEDQRLTAFVMSGFGLAALLLTVVGLYALLAFYVAERTREIGIRMALGAAHSSVIRMVLREGMLLVAIGGIAGVVAAIASARALAHKVTGLGGVDAVAMLAAVAILCAAALLACWLPARRAAKVDPMVALRYE